MSEQLYDPRDLNSTARRVEVGKRYYIYTGSAMFIYSKVAPVDGATGISVRFFTNPTPGTPAADVILAGLHAPDQRDASAPHIPFPDGIYFEVFGNDLADVCTVSVNYVKYEDYFPLYQAKSAAQQEAWESALGRGGTDFLTDFDAGTADQGAWVGDGGAGAIVPISGFLPLDGSDPMTGDLVVTESADHSETPSAGLGQFWVRNDAPCVPMFTDDAGNDTVLGAGGGGEEHPFLHQFRFHTGAATFATAQEETIFKTRVDMTAVGLQVSTSRTGGTGTSTATKYWRVRAYNGGSASGTLLGEWASHDGVSTADDMADQFDVKEPSLSNVSIPAGTVVTMEVWAETSGGSPISLNSEAFVVCLFATED